MRRGIAAGLSIAALMLPAGCGTADEPAADDPATAAAVLAEVNAHNDTDVTFVRDMIPHHAQGMELADLGARHTSTSAVRDLATLIDRQQGVEIDQLRGQLTTWNVVTAPTMTVDMAGSMAGMATPDTLTRLRGVRGAAFDRLWLQTMIRHHEGAVVMARAELAAGIQRGARNTAQNIISVQRAQIDTMNGLLSAR